MSADRDDADVVNHEVVGSPEIAHEGTNFFECARGDLLEGSLEEEADEVVARS